MLTNLVHKKSYYRWLGQSCFKKWSHWNFI